MDDKEFYRKYDAYDREALRETIEYLIEQRQKLRDEEIERLEAKASNLLKKLQYLRTEQIVEEISCFRHVLALQRRLQENDKQRD